jgi:hypothetical protein
LGGKALGNIAALPERNTSTDRPVLRVVILASPPVEELDIVGPMEVFATVNRLRQSRQLAPIYQIELLLTFTYIGLQLQPSHA